MFNRTREFKFSSRKIKQMTYLDETLETPKHYDNSKGSIYQFCENQNLNSYEFDIIKRVVRSKKRKLQRRFRKKQNT